MKRKRGNTKTQSVRFCLKPWSNPAVDSSADSHAWFPSRVQFLWMASSSSVGLTWEASARLRWGWVLRRILMLALTGSQSGRGMGISQAQDHGLCQFLLLWVLRLDWLTSNPFIGWGSWFLKRVFYSFSNLEPQLK